MWEQGWFCGENMRDTECRFTVGYQAVYRVNFGMSLFFFTMMLLMIKVRNSDSWRAKVQNGFWFFKYLFVAGVSVGGFFINGQFSSVWMYFGLIGGFLFVLIQVLVLIDFVHRWAATWVDKYQESRKKIWFFTLLACSLGFYIAAVTGTVILFVYYGSGGDCLQNCLIISFNCTACVAFSLLSVNRKIQEGNSHSGLLQSSVLSAYVIFLTWSAFTSNPNSECNPSLSAIFLPEYNTTLSVNKADSATFATPELGLTTASLLLWILSILHSAITAAPSTLNLKSNETSEVTIVIEDSDDVREISDQDDEKESVAYSYSWFHAMLCLSTFYVMMTLTGWYEPTSNRDVSRLRVSNGSYWMKIAASWISIALYSWTLIAPILIKNRDFS